MEFTYGWIWLIGGIITYISLETWFIFFRSKNVTTKLTKSEQIGFDEFIGANVIIAMTSAGVPGLCIGLFDALKTYTKDILIAIGVLAGVAALVGIKYGLFKLFLRVNPRHKPENSIPRVSKRRKSQSKTKSKTKKLKSKNKQNKNVRGN